MPRCWAVQETLTAWIDGEMSPRQSAQTRRHLAACATCTAEAASLRGTIEGHRRVLAAAVAADGCDLDGLWARLQRARTAESDAATPSWDWRGMRPRWWWLVPPTTIAAVAVAVAVYVLVRIGGPADVLIPLGVKPPPVAVAREPEFFKDYPLIERLDVLEHFDTVESEPLDDDQPSQRG